MQRKMIGYFGPLLDAVDGGGGGGDAGGGGGENATPTGTITQTSAIPSAVDVSDDTFIRIKGQEKPVKFGEHVKGFQGQFTKASQEAARLKAALQEREDRIRRYEDDRNRAQQQNQNQGQKTPDLYSQLESLPYLSGKDARAVVESIQGAITQRDQVLIATLKKLQQVEKVLNGLNENHSAQSFETKISKWLTDGGYDQGYGDLAKEIYLAYEGDDLDNEFPQIFANRVKQIEDLIAARNNAKVNAARKTPFVPGRGGNTGPSQALKIKPNATPQELADELWEQIQSSET